MQKDTDPSAHDYDIIICTFLILAHQINAFETFSPDHNRGDDDLFLQTFCLTQNVWIEKFRSLYDIRNTVLTAVHT